MAENDYRLEIRRTSDSMVSPSKYSWELWVGSLRLRSWYGATRWTIRLTAWLTMRGYRRAKRKGHDGKVWTYGAEKNHS